MVKGRMNHAIRQGRATAQAFEVFQRASMRLSAGICERLCTLIGTSQPDHLMAGANQLGNKSGTDESGSAGNKNTHEKSPFISFRGRLRGPVNIKIGD